MAFVLNSRVKIGNYAFAGGINDLVIKKSVNIIVDSAKLTIPGLGRVTNIKSVINSALSFIGMGSHPITNNLPNNSIETAILFKEGDTVSIDLGYNGQLKNEFRGFVRRVNITTPISIEMEGYAWQLRNQNILASWGPTTVKEVLQRIIQGTDIILSPDIPVIHLTSFRIPHHNGLDVLQYMKDKMLLTVYFDDNVLYVGIEEGRTTNLDTSNGSLLAEVVYNIGYNVPTNQPDLKKRLAANNLVRVRLKVKGKDGKNTLYEAGDAGGSVHNKQIAHSTDANYLKMIAADRLKSLKYDGYEGNINGFLQPYCKPGWKATIIDKRYQGARSGTYFVPGIEVTFGVKGARRKVDITYKLD